MKKIVISLDAMGGVGAPRSVIQAAFAVSIANPKIHFLIFGIASQVQPILEELAFVKSRYDFIEAQSVIGDHDKPVQAFREGKESSMRKAVDSLKDGSANACLSCGNTGALMVTSKMVLGTLPGVKRPAIAGAFPSYNGKIIMLDMGANVECSEYALFQFALMGVCLAKIAMKLEKPSIAILNVGEEKGKGREIEQSAYDLLQESGLNFIGYIEGHDIVKGKADVVVTDGFSGNLVLKASEGAAHMFLNLLKNSTNRTSGIISMLGGLLLKKSLKSNFIKIDPNSNNGAMFIGLNGIVVKSHGAATVSGIINAINLAYELAIQDINSNIIKEIQELEDQGIGLNIVEKIKQSSAKFLGISK